MNAPPADMALILAYLNRIEGKLEQIEDFKVPRYLSLKSVAKIVDMNENAVRQMIHRREIPSYLFGNRRLVLFDDLKRHLVRHPSHEEITGE